jgi:DHA1 family bicyclomycin/chloramphenicol resistance-like MFS transporter
MSFAPVVGVWLNTQFGWRSSFLFILALAILSWIGITFFLPETLPREKRRAFRIQSVIADYISLIKNRNFLIGSFVWTFMFTALIVYTANISLLFIGHMHLSERAFGFYQAVTMGSFGIFSLAYFIGRLGGEKVKKSGTLLYFLGAVFLLWVNFFYPHSPLLISLSMGMMAAGTALAIVVYFTDSMVGIASAGAALSFVQGLRLFLSSQATDLSRIIFDGTLNSIVWVVTGTALTTLGFIFLLPKPQPELKNSDNQVHAII